MSYIIYKNEVAAITHERFKAQHVRISWIKNKEILCNVLDAKISNNKKWKSERDCYIDIATLHSDEGYLEFYAKESPQIAHEKEYMDSRKFR